MQTKDEAVEHFRYKAPNDETRVKHEKVTDAFVDVVVALYDLTPDGPGKTVALRKLAEARMAFNSAIANKGQ